MTSLNNKGVYPLFGQFIGDVKNRTAYLKIPIEYKIPTNVQVEKFLLKHNWIKKEAYYKKDNFIDDEGNEIVFCVNKCEDCYDYPYVFEHILEFIVLAEEKKHIDI